MLAQVKYEKATHEVVVNDAATVANLQTRVFLRTKVLPMRQKLIGFKGAKAELSQVFFSNAAAASNVLCTHCTTPWNCCAVTGEF